MLNVYTNVVLYVYLVLNIQSLFLHILDCFIYFILAETGKDAVINVTHKCGSPSEEEVRISC